MVGTASAAALPVENNGYMAQVHVQLPDSAPLTVVGMYCPHNMGDRRRLYSIFDNMQHTATNPMVVAGDFNATIHDSDRHSHKRTAADSAHRAFLQRHNLRPIDAEADGTPRQYTFRKAYRRYSTERAALRGMQHKHRVHGRAVF